MVLGGRSGILWQMLVFGVVYTGIQAHSRAYSVFWEAGRHIVPDIGIWCILAYGPGRQVGYIVAYAGIWCILAYGSGRQVGHIVADAGIWCGISWHTGA